jgi:hypothetical protein
MTKENFTYKSTFPLTFYLIRGILIGGFVFICFILKDDYLIMFVCAYLTFIFTLNKDNYIIEVYPDRFNIILPSFYGKIFDQTTTYYYKDISDFEYSKGYYDLKAAVFGEVVRKVLPINNMGVMFAYQKPTLTFTDKTYKKENISYTFNSNRESIEKGLRLVEDNLKNINS